jgi:hypothetical protein
VIKYHDRSIVLDPEDETRVGYYYYTRVFGYIEYEDFCKTSNEHIEAMFEIHSLFEEVKKKESKNK